MFGFGKRKKYNASVDVKINNEYYIKTKGNDKFPGVLFYLELIDDAWKAKMTEDEASLYIATIYYCGLLEKGFKDESAHLYKRINEVVGYKLEKGIIRSKIWDEFHDIIKKARHDFCVL